MFERVGDIVVSDGTQSKLLLELKSERWEEHQKKLLFESSELYNTN